MSTYSAPQKPSKAGSRSTPSGASSHARVVPSTAAAAATATPSARLCARGLSVRPDAQAARSVPPSARPRTTSQASGVANTQATSAVVAASQRGAGAAGARRVAARGSDAVEATGPDQLDGPLQATAEVVHVVARRLDRAERRQPLGGGDAGDQRVLEGLVAEVALRLGSQQELDEARGLVGLVAAGQHAHRGGDDERTDVAAVEVVVAARGARVLLLEAVVVVVVDEPHRDLAAADSLHDGVVVGIGPRPLAGRAPEP